MDSITGMFNVTEIFL
uniref:Uncharacterized protein n=1 Tax=Rhizophora mucronata TaxID=61149 RepID=A0A2P2Q6B9_RHIMU